MRTPGQQEQLRRIRSRGGKASLAQRTPAERSEVARSGGEGRARKLTRRQRSESARKAALARWKKPKIAKQRKTRKGVQIEA